MQTYQFTIPAQSNTRSLFLDKIALEFGGFTAWAGIGSWYEQASHGPHVTTGHVVTEEILIVQVTTDEWDILRERVIVYLRNEGEQAAYFGHVGDHKVITLNPKED